MCCARPTVWCGSICPRRRTSSTCTIPGSGRCRTSSTAVRAVFWGRSRIRIVNYRFYSCFYFCALSCPTSLPTTELPSRSDLRDNSNCVCVKERKGQGVETEYQRPGSGSARWKRGPLGTPFTISIEQCDDFRYVAFVMSESAAPRAHDIIVDMAARGHYHFTLCERGCS